MVAGSSHSVLDSLKIHSTKLYKTLHFQSKFESSLWGKNEKTMRFLFPLFLDTLKYIFMESLHIYSLNGSSHTIHMRQIFFNLKHHGTYSCKEGSSERKNGKKSQNMILSQSKSLQEVGLLCSLCRVVKLILDGWLL